jgi:hypothetical protein
MNLKKSLLAVLAGSVFFVSCSSDDDNNNEVVPTGDYAHGTFVLNEGYSSPSSASVSFIGEDGVVQQDIYAAVNPGKPELGSYLQSMFFDDERAFIISGQANKVTIVNRYTFEFIASVEGNFDNPRYGAVANGKAYITNSANFANADDFLTVINLADFSTSKVELNAYAERIIEEDDMLYIANGYYNNGTTVTVFNPVTNTANAVIELGVSPNSLDEDNGILYVLGENKISRINLANNTIISAVDLSTDDARNITIEDDKAYYTDDTAVYTIAANSQTAPTAPLFSYVSNSQFGAMYGFNVKDGKIYVADGGDFASDNDVYTYSLTGTLLNTYTVGVGPNGFYFND